MLWCRSQTWLRPGTDVAVAEAGSYSSDSTPKPLAWKPPYTSGTTPERQKKKKKRKKKKKKKKKKNQAYEKEIQP